MKTQLMLLIAGSIVAGMLYAGLPEQPALHDLKASPSSTESRDLPPEAHPIGLDTLRPHQAVVADRLDEIGQSREMEAPTPIILSHTLGDETDNAPGLTVYLEAAEIARAGSQQGGWTAIRFHDAGVAPDGSHQAVMTIHPNLAPSPPSTPDSIRVGSSNWQ